MIKLAQKLIEEKKSKALEMVGKKILVEINNKAISIDSDKKTATFVMSTENIDRHGDRVDQASWNLKYFKLSPMFFFQHRSDEFPLGKWINVGFENDPINPGKQMLVGTAEFRTEFEDASRAFRHVEAGDISSVSVGFIPHRVEYDEETDCFVLYDCELLECSLVGVGSNRQALIKGTDGTDALDKTIEAKEALDRKIKSTTDQNLIISHMKVRESLNKAINRLKYN